MDNNKANIIVNCDSLVFLLLSNDEYFYMLVNNGSIQIKEGRNTPVMSFKPYHNEKLLSYKK